jgi:fucose 4-O-acetylase-like acetyltransferase
MSEQIERAEREEALGSGGSRHVWPGATGIRDGRIDALRGFACLLLVAYHVIGSSSSGGLHLDYPHPLRLFAEALADLRMPVFAFVSGFVYQYRPATIEGYRQFLKGKINRILIPGFVAIVVFQAASWLTGSRFSLPLSSVWEPFVYSYAHFWYLQAIFVILVTFGLIDAVLRNRGTIILLSMASVVQVMNVVPGGGLLSFSGVLYLTPYFLFGVVFHRRLDVVIRTGFDLAWVGVIVAAAAAAYKVSLHLPSATHATNKNNIESLVLGLSLCVVLFFFFSARSQFLEKIGEQSLFIYLYHPLGASAMRQALFFLGIRDPYMHLLPGFLAGIACSVAIVAVAERYPLSRRLVLGRKNRRQPRGWQPPHSPTVDTSEPSKVVSN